MRLLVLGPTGVVGAEVVREALQDARFSRVMAISRRPLPVTHPRLETLLHADFRDFTDLRSRFSDVNAAICALLFGTFYFLTEGLAVLFRAVPARP